MVIQVTKRTWTAWLVATLAIQAGFVMAFSPQNNNNNKQATTSGPLRTAFLAPPPIENLKEDLASLLKEHLRKKLPKANAVRKTNAAAKNKKTTEATTVAEPWYQEFEVLRGGTLDREQLEPFFEQRPQYIAKRLVQVARTLYQAKQDWEQNQNAAALCAAVSSLGPLAVKVGQTLSQRQDLVGKEMAEALKSLQTKNAPFDNYEAYSVLHQSLDYWDGPLAANLVTETDYYDSSDKIPRQGSPLFEYISPEPIAAASLGQVYKARRHDGTEVAVKVQRPDAQAILAMDAQCFRLVWQWKDQLGNAQELLESLFKDNSDQSNNPIPGQTEQQVRAELGSDQATTVAAVLDRVAMDVQKELDYRIEANNGQRFRETLDFLGFVTTPTVVQATDRVLVTEWIRGKHLSDLNREDGLKLTQMAVQACTASMVLTGFVHADPHEGNLMLHEDGRIVFLDFGLMSEVDPEKMEGFARGIQALLSENWMALTEAFVDIGFITDPIRHRNGLHDLWRIDPKWGLNELAQEVEVAMKKTNSANSRFGALSEVLQKEISPRWLVFMPPYILLLVRTFVTLEGMAASIDPTFNIYEMAMPWAIKRTLSPSTEKGIEVFRSTLLTEENKIQWQRIMELASAKKEEKEEKAVQTTAKPTDQEEAKKAAMNDAMTSLLGSSDGRALRRIIKDLDSVDLLARLASRDNRHLLEKVSTKLLSNKEKEEKVSPAAQGSSLQRSPEYTRLQNKQQKWRKQVLRVLILGHLRQCLLQWRGLKTTIRLAAVSLKVFLTTWWQQKKQRRILLAAATSRN